MALFAHILYLPGLSEGENLWPFPVIFQIENRLLTWASRTVQGRDLDSLTFNLIFCCSYPISSPSCCSCTSQPLSSRPKSPSYPQYPPPHLLSEILVHLPFVCEKSSSPWSKATLSRTLLTVHQMCSPLTQLTEHRVSPSLMEPGSALGFSSPLEVMSRLLEGPKDANLAFRNGENEEKLLISTLNSRPKFWYLQTTEDILLIHEHRRAHTHTYTHTLSLPWIRLGGLSHNDSEHVLSS